MPLYFAAERPTVERDGLLLMVDDERFPLEPARSRSNALGPLPHARLLSADRRGRERGRDAAEEIIQEMLLTTTSERQGRAIDQDAGGASMEKKKQEGYF